MGLHALAAKGQIDKLKRALDKGADVNERDENGTTLLHSAVFRNQVEAMKFLIA